MTTYVIRYSYKGSLHVWERSFDNRQSRDMFLKDMDSLFWYSAVFTRKNGRLKRKGSE